jgi:AmmeMemoRadiSam system protein A
MSQPVTLQLTEAHQQLLLQIARSAVDSYLAGRRPSLPEPADQSLMEPRGVFVSLHQNNQLRGCIGNVNAVSPLYRTTAECAIAAAVGDPRFMPLAAAELPMVEFEISVLSSLQSVKDVGEIEVGRHGLVVSNRTARGLLLPQVATAYGWDRVRFLQETCKKAGLPPDNWKQDATIHSFSALVFREQRIHLTAS